MDVDVGCGVRWSCAPVGAPGDGGNKAHVGEQDVVVLDAVQGEVHLAQRQPVQLELQLHLQAFKHRQSGQAGYDPVASGTGWTRFHHNLQIYNYILDMNKLKLNTL